MHDRMRARQSNPTYGSNTPGLRMDCGAIRCHGRWLVAFLVVLTVFVILSFNALISLRSVFTYLHLRSDSDLELEIVPEAIVQKYDAYCLDGSPPAFYIRRGTASRNWLIALAPGKFCWDPADCATRASTQEGSSHNLPKFKEFREGLLSADAAHNPDFHDWNVVYVHYCDGGLFLGARPVNREESEENSDKAAQAKGGDLYYRGYFVLLAVLHHLANSYKVYEARNVLFVGSHLTGLALPLTVDHLKSMFFTSVSPINSTATVARLPGNLLVTLPPISYAGTKVKLLMDSSFVVDRPNRQGRAVLAEALAQLFETHRIANTPVVMRSLTSALQEAQKKEHSGERRKSKKNSENKPPTSKSALERCVEEYYDRDPSPSDLRINLPRQSEDARPNYAFKCLYPQHIARFQEVPMLVVQSAYDKMSRELVLETDCDYIQACEGDERSFAFINSYRIEVISHLGESVLLNRARRNGVFVPSCFADSWLFDQDLFDRIRVDRVPLRKLVTAWFHDRALHDGDKLFETYELIDRIYPSNTDCYGLEIERGLRRD